MHLHRTLHDLGGNDVIGDVLSHHGHNERPQRQHGAEHKAKHRGDSRAYPGTDNRDQVHDAGKDGHECRVGMANERKADKGEDATADGRHDHAAHITADRARKNRDHKAVRGLFFLSDDGTDLVVHTGIIAGKPVGKHQTQEDYEQLRGRVGDQREHAATELSGDLRYVLGRHSNQRGQIIVQVLLERRVVERLSVRNHLVEITARNAKLLRQTAQDFHNLTEQNRRQDADDADEHCHNHDQRDERTDATTDAVMLEPVSDRRHHKSDDGTDSEKLDNRRQDTHKVKDDGGDDNAADDSPNAKRQNTSIAQRAVGLLGVLNHERTITPSG